MGGACCGTENHVDHLLLIHINHLKIISLPVSVIYDLLYPKETMVNGFDLKNLSEESLNLYKKSFRTISKDAFDQIAKKHFYDQLDPFQSTLFDLIHQNAKSCRSIVFLYLIALCRGSEEDKMKYFIDAMFSLEDRTKNNYSAVKESIADYIKNTLAMPLIALKTAHDDDEFVMQSIDYMQQELYSEDNQIIFNEYIFDTFDKGLAMDNEDNEDVKLFNFYSSHLEEILQSHKYFMFSFLNLKDAFNKKIS